MNTKIWKAHTKRLIEGTSCSIATEIKKDGENLIKRHPQRRGFIASSKTPDDFSTYMKILIHDLEGLGKIALKERDVKMQGKIDDIIDPLIERMRDLTKGYRGRRDLAGKIFGTGNVDASSLVSREQKLLKLGLMFLEAATDKDVNVGKVYLKSGLPVNFQHPVNGTTALHRACAYTTEPSAFARMLLETGECDLLVKDGQGRLAYELCYVFGYDVELAAKIREMTIEQSAKKGITVNFGFEVRSEPAPGGP